MIFRKGKTEIELNDPNTFSIAQRAGFSEVTKEESPKEMIADRYYEDNADSDLIKCKKCGKSFGNRGLFLAHCRNEHKGGD